MKYTLKSLKIEELIIFIENQTLDLSPSYQREFIWSLKDQKELVNTIFKGYPLPNLFINILPNGKMEMVDGQQRSRSIYRFYKDEIKFNRNETSETWNINEFKTYELPIVFIENSKQEEIREFYVLINKKGKFLNNPEVQRSEFQETNFLRLSESLTSNQKFLNLDLFSSSSTIRLNDRDFVQELLAYLLMCFYDSEKNTNEGYEGLRDKKQFIDKEIFKNDISEDEAKMLELIFLKIIEKITILDKFQSISNSRYRQRNDFYTLFNFINKHSYIEEKLLVYQYQILLALDNKDNDGNQMIRPSNEECEALMKYALHCVSQSNSKNARKARLDFFESLLLNKDEEYNNNNTLSEVIWYLEDIYGEDKAKVKKIEEYYLIDVNLLNN